MEVRYYCHTCKHDLPEALWKGEGDCPSCSATRGNDPLLKAADILEKKAEEREQFAYRMPCHHMRARVEVETQANTYRTIAKALRGEDG